MDWLAHKGHSGIVEWAIPAALRGDPRRGPLPEPVAPMPRPVVVSVPLLDDPAMRGLALTERIHRTCLTAILDGRLPAGARLPSARALAVAWRVSRNTVDDAIGRLQAEGLLDRQVGRGSFVTAAAARVAAPASTRLPRGPSALGRDALRHASAWSRDTAQAWTPGSVPRPEPFVAGHAALDLFPLDLWRRLVARRLRASGAALLGYLPAGGYPPLRVAIAQHLAATRGVVVHPQQVMVLNSAVQAVELVARTLLSPGDTVWIEDPGLPNVRAAFGLARVRIGAVPVDGDGLDLDHAERRLAAPALIHATPSCQYPTGAVLSLDRRIALARLAARCGAWIVEDDYQSEFVWEGRPLATIRSVDPAGRTLYAGSFSNAVFPSLRLAYLVLPPALVAVFEAVRRQLDDHTHGLLQAVLADFIDGGHFAAHLRRMRAVYAARRDALAAALDRALPDDVVRGPMAAGMTVALALPARLPDTAVVARAAEHGLRVLPLSRYAQRAGRVNGLLLGYTALSERRIATAVARLAPLLR